MKEISPILFFKLYQKSNNIRIIDVRDSFQFEQYHLINSINIPADLLYDKYYLFLNMRTTYYILCKNGAISKQVTLYLENLGYKVINVIGGLDCWVESYNIIYNQ